MTTMSAKKERLMYLLKKQKGFVLRIDQTIGIVFLGANYNRNLIHLKLKTVYMIYKNAGVPEGLKIWGCTNY